MKFREETINEFNLYSDTTLKENMTFSEAVENIEDANNFYFYVSMCREDMINAISDQKEVADQLSLDNIYLKELGIFISLHP